MQIKLDLYTGSRKINLRIVFAGNYAGIHDVSSIIRLVSFMDYASGLLDETEDMANTFMVYGEGISLSLCISYNFVAA
jgi:hypothetical protein